MCIEWRGEWKRSEKERFEQKIRVQYAKKTIQTNVIGIFRVVIVGNTGPHNVLIILVEAEFHTTLFLSSYFSHMFYQCNRYIQYIVRPDYVLSGSSKLECVKKTFEFVNETKNHFSVWSRQFISVLSVYWVTFTSWFIGIWKFCVCEFVSRVISFFVFLVYVFRFFWR